jgi:hypothetical protein
MSYENSKALRETKKQIEHNRIKAEADATVSILHRIDALGADNKLIEAAKAVVASYRNAGKGYRPHCYDEGDWEDFNCNGEIELLAALLEQRSKDSGGVQYDG